MSIVNSPLFSFYMTVKDGLPYILNATESMRNQTYFNWECVIVDDASTDGTVAFLKVLESKDSRFKVFFTDGVGRGVALNIALGNCSGKYVANLDADDMAHPQRAKLQVYFMEKYNYNFTSSLSTFIYDSELPKWEDVDDYSCVVLKSLNSYLFKSNPVSHTTVAMNREVLLSVGGYDEKRKAQLDYELWGRLASFGIELVLIDKKLGAKRIHGAQSFENKNRLSYLFSSVSLQAKIIKDLSGSRVNYFYPIARLFYGCLPQIFRVKRRLL